MANLKLACTGVLKSKVREAVRLLRIHIALCDATLPCDFTAVHVALHCMHCYDNAAARTRVSECIGDRVHYGTDSTIQAAGAWEGITETLPSTESWVYMRTAL